MFHTYILYSESRAEYYTGYTSNKLEVRLDQHNSGWNPSTKSGVPWHIVYYKSFEEKSAAIKWERFIKRQKSRVFIEKLIGSSENEYLARNLFVHYVS